MADEKVSAVESELNDHKTELTTWISDVEKLKVPAVAQGVIARFTRDCNILIADVDKITEPSSADLCDFADRRNSLEIQFHHIQEEYEDAPSDS